MAAYNIECLCAELDMAKAIMKEKDDKRRCVDLQFDDAKLQAKQARDQMNRARSSYRSALAEYKKICKENYYLEKSIGKVNAKSEKRNISARDMKNLGSVLYQRKLEEIANRLEAEWLSAYGAMIAANVLYYEACKRRNSLEFDNEIALCNFVEARNEVAALTRQWMDW